MGQGGAGRSGRGGVQVMHLSFYLNDSLHVKDGGGEKTLPDGLCVKMDVSLMAVCFDFLHHLQPLYQ